MKVPDNMAESTDPRVISVMEQHACAFDLLDGIAEQRAPARRPFMITCNDD